VPACGDYRTHVLRPVKLNLCHMRYVTALTSVVIFAILLGSVLLGAPQPTDARPRILSVGVVSGDFITMTPPKFPNPIQVYGAKNGAIKLFARVDGLETLDVMVAMNSRMSFGRFEGHFVGDGFVIIEVELPTVGSQWPSPGPGVSSPPQTVTIEPDQIFFLQVIGASGTATNGESIPVPGEPILVVRTQ
jgi:hypothetical protein